MKRRWLAVLLGVLAMPGVAAAHNAGHIILPDGRCLEIGSFRDAPVVGQDRTPLDLVPQTPNPPFDEYGVSFAGFWGRTPIFPGPCRMPPPMSTAAATGETSAKEAANTMSGPAASDVQEDRSFVSLGGFRKLSRSGKR